eukprot:TRINITY_DN4754_c1_g1_i1.p1 TRINITY_DN4754_c1_g1~~TRINITY_DN4754_c1_g1_i1.p1  ORF type:complete len:200 (+),score=49.03 TRINITY_DN4754_c1_g1_i1:44-601(+)
MADQNTDNAQADESQMSTLEISITAILIVFILYMLKKLLFSSEPVRQPVVIKPREIILRNFSEEELKQFDGRNDETPIYICVKGKIYDCTRSRMFYGAGGPYAVFAGRDASRALALQSTDLKDVDNYSLEGLSPSELDALNDWIMTYEMKYPVVGYLKRNGEETPLDKATRENASKPTTDEKKNE